MKTEMKLPLCLHEAAIERHFVTDPSTGIREHDSYLEKALSAMRLSRQMGEKVLHSHSAIMANALAMPIANQKKSRETGIKFMEAGTRAIDEAVTAIESEIDAINRKLSGPAKPKDLAEMGLQREIRDALKVLPVERRVETINAAIVSNDAPICSAVLNAPPLLLDLTFSQIEAMRLNWQTKHHARDFDRRARLKKATDDLYRAGGALQEFVLGMTDSRGIEQAEASERAAAAYQ